jgi:hypothetical protein
MMHCQKLTAGPDGLRPVFSPESAENRRIPARLANWNIEL